MTPSYRFSAETEIAAGRESCGSSGVSADVLFVFLLRFVGIQSSFALSSPEVEAKGRKIDGTASRCKKFFLLSNDSLWWKTGISFGSHSKLIY